MKHKETNVAFLGVLPPPETGRTSVTRKIVAVLSERYNVYTYDFLPKGRKPRRLWRVNKNARTINALFKLWFWKVDRKVNKLYLACISGWGILYDVLLAFFAKKIRYQLFIHHHSYFYINRFNWRMNLLTKIAGDNCCHILLCKAMMYQFRSLYPSAINCTILSNGFMLDKIQSHCKTHSGSRIVLGHISNLSKEKGLGLVIRTFASIRASGFDITLVLAGPTNSENDERLISLALEKFPHAIDYRGPVYGWRKKEFFNDIHIMLFPSRYKNEAQPLVIFEALSCGVPVICFDRGCIGNMIDSRCGMLVMQGENFVKMASSYIINCLKDKDQYREYSRCAIEQATELKCNGLEELEEITALIGKR